MSQTCNPIHFSAIKIARLGVLRDTSYEQNQLWSPSKDLNLAPTTCRRIDLRIAGVPGTPTGDKMVEGNYIEQALRSPQPSVNN